jgi:hypothetical protein
MFCRASGESPAVIYTIGWVIRMKFLASLALLVCICLVACISPEAGGGMQPPLTVAQRPPVPAPPAAAPVPEKTKPAPPASTLETHTMLTVYGRAFGVAPILGRLGQYQDFEDMSKDVLQWAEPIKKESGKKGVIIGLHLIYALAIPCTPRLPDCLLYLEARDKDIVGRYIQPAAERGWVVILDTQLGRSNPVDQVSRMISKGYLKYDNVHVAIDPEFHAYEGKDRPGIPIGTVEASEINKVQEMLDEYVIQEGLPHKKVLIVHQFGDENVNDGVPFMIQNKKELKTFANVDLVINADGFGMPPIKTHKYNKITDGTVYPFLKFRGIKLFYPNRWEKAGHFDKPPLRVPQVFGNEPVTKKLKILEKPDLVIIA